MNVYYVVVSYALHRKSNYSPLADTAYWVYMYIKTAGISDVSFEIYKDDELYDTVNIEKNVKMKNLLAI